MKENKKFLFRSFRGTRLLSTYVPLAIVNIILSSFFFCYFIQRLFECSDCCKVDEWMVRSSVLGVRIYQHLAKHTFSHGIHKRSFLAVLFSFENKVFDGEGFLQFLHPFFSAHFVELNLSLDFYSNLV